MEYYAFPGGSCVFEFFAPFFLKSYATEKNLSKLWKLLGLYNWDIQSNTVQLKIDPDFLILGLLVNLRDRKNLSMSRVKKSFPYKIYSYSLTEKKLQKICLNLDDSNAQWRPTIGAN